MMKSKEEVAAATITLAEQLGGPEADSVTRLHVMELRQLLASRCRGPYSKDVAEFALVLRVDGEFQKFGFEGFERLRRSYKERYITIDIGIPETRWRGVPPEEFRRFLNESVKNALRLCVERLKKDKTIVDEAKLFHDYAQVEAEYMRSA